jgi:hypothetical protein
VDFPNVGGSISETLLSPGGFDSIIPYGEVVAFQIGVDSEDAI